MSLGKPEWPEVGELVVATIRRIESYGAYVYLDEYDKEGLLHISEISSTWVRNIRNHVRERQKAVLQVRRIDSAHGHIDLSLRRVSMDERRKKIEDWKKNRRAEALLKSAANTLNINEMELFEEVGIKLIDSFGSLYNGLEAAAKKGVEALTDLGISKKMAETLTEIAEEKIVVGGVTIHGIFEITSMDRRGVESIKETLLGTIKLADKEDAETTIYALGAPKYRIEVSAEDYKKAEAVLEKIVTTIKSSWSSIDGDFSFSRE